jgi:excisionase family DNA binding protein
MVKHGALVGAQSIEPTAADRTSATELEAAVNSRDDAELVVRLSDDTVFRLPSAFMRLVRASAKEFAAGRGITMLTTETMLSPAETAGILGYSRPFIQRLLDEGQIPSERLPGSRHRRIRLSDILAFQQRRDLKREGRQAIATAYEEADIPY